MSLIEYFNLPKENIREQIIPMSYFIKNNTHSVYKSDDYKDVKEIKLLGFLSDRENKKAQYRQVPFIQIEVNKTDNLQKIASNVFNEPKNATVLLFRHGDRTKIALSVIGESKVNKDKNALGYILFSQWIYDSIDMFDMASLDIAKYDLSDLFAWYNGFYRFVRRNNEKLIRIKFAEKMVYWYYNEKIKAPIYNDYRSVIDYENLRYIKTSQKIRKYDVSELWHELLQCSFSVKKLQKDDIRSFEELISHSQLKWDNVEG